MLLVLHNNLKSTTNNIVAEGGITLSGEAADNINGGVIHNIVGSGGITVGGITVSVSEKSFLGFKCNDGAIYIKAQYVEAQSNIKRRDYTGRGRKSKALVAGITLCNQGLYHLFPTNETEEVE